MLFVISPPVPPFLLATSVFAWNCFRPMWSRAAEWCAVWSRRLLHGGWSWSGLPNPGFLNLFLRNNISLRLVPISTTVQKAVSRTNSAHLMKMDFQECGMTWDLKIYLTTSQKDSFTSSIGFWLAARPFWKGCHLCLLTPRFYKSEKLHINQKIFQVMEWCGLTTDVDCGSRPCLDAELWAQPSLFCPKKENNHPTQPPQTNVNCEINHRDKSK